MTTRTKEVGFVLLAGGLAALANHRNKQALLLVGGATTLLLILAMSAPEASAAPAGALGPCCAGCAQRGMS